MAAGRKSEKKDFSIRRFSDNIRCEKTKAGTVTPAGCNGADGQGQTCFILFLERKMEERCLN